MNGQMPCGWSPSSFSCTGNSETNCLAGRHSYQRLLPYARPNPLSCSWKPIALVQEGQTCFLFHRTALRPSVVTAPSRPPVCYFRVHSPLCLRRLTHEGHEVCGQFSPQVYALPLHDHIRNRWRTYSNPNPEGLRVWGFMTNGF